MANHIQTLQAKVAEQQATIAKMEQRMSELRAYLLSDKFKFIQQDGSRGDLVATSDIMNWLRYIQFED